VLPDYFYFFYLPKPAEDVMKTFSIPLRQNAVLIFIVLHAHPMVVAREIPFSFAQ